MAMKIMYAGALFFAGWLWFYLFMRQFLFNFTIAYPLIRSMQDLNKDLISVGARRYTTTSVVTCSVISVIVLFVIIRFCPLYLIISFAVGALICMIMLIPKISLKNREMFDSFCTAYCRFVPDDELRKVMYEKDLKKIDKRLREMELERSFIPDFPS